jgi:3-deoxy-D-manno-octulosonic-acid transferase
MLRVYNAALLPLRALAPAIVQWKSRDAARAEEWRQRFAREVPAIRPGGIWIHGASVGEARIVRSLAAALRRRLGSVPLAVSAVTSTGRGGLPGAPDVDASFFLPLDLPGYPDRVFEAIAPTVLVLVETELWPNLLHEAALRRIPVCIVNGRLSPSRMARYRRFRSLYRPLLQGLARIGAQTESEAGRFRELGAAPSAVVVTGNMKYDLPEPEATEEALRRRFGLEDRPVVVAGSTGEGEDPLVLEAFRSARAGRPDLFLVLAPRHPERADAVAHDAEARQVRLHRLSSGEDARAGAADGLLLDRVGELAALYAIAACAFVGGSLVPIGGHNLLEPAAAGVPVLFGPHVDHVEQDARALLDAGGAIEVASGAELADRFADLLRDEGRRRAMGAAARELFASGRGAMERTLDLVLSQRSA